MSKPATPSTSTLSDEDKNAADLLFGGTTTDTIDSSEYQKQVTLVTANGNTPALNTKTKPAELEQVKTKLVISISSITNVESLFTTDVLDQILIEYNKDRSSVTEMKVAAGTMEALKAGKAIYTVLVQYMSADLLEQITGHIQYSVYSLWTAILKVISPLDVTTSFRAVIELSGGNLWKGDEYKMGSMN